MKGIYPRADRAEVRRRLGILRELQALPRAEKERITKGIIGRALEIGKGAVLFSGGRDSTVLLRIIREATPGILVIYNNTALGDPALTDHIRQHTRGMNYRETIASDPIRMWKEKGYYPLLSKRGFTAYKKRIPGLRTSPVQCCYQLKEMYANRLLKAEGVKVVFWGNRAAESMRRRFTFVDNGFLFQPKKYPWQQAYPLQHWTDDDIAGYIADHEPNYPAQRRHFETGCLCCGTDITHFPNNLSRLYQRDRVLWETYMRAGFAEQILRIQGRAADPATVEMVIQDHPAILLKV